MSPHPTLHGSASHIESRTLARTSDPATSHQAAARVHEIAKAQEEAIVRTLGQYGPMTCDQIAERLGWETSQVNRRTPELKARGVLRVKAIGKSKSGRAARVWEAVSA